MVKVTRAHIQRAEQLHALFDGEDEEAVLVVWALLQEGLIERYSAGGLKQIARGLRREIVKTLPQPPRGEPS